VRSGQTEPGDAGRVLEHLACDPWRSLLLCPRPEQVREERRRGARAGTAREKRPAIRHGIHATTPQSLGAVKYICAARAGVAITVDLLLPIVHDEEMGGAPRRNRIGGERSAACSPRPSPHASASGSGRTRFFVLLHLTFASGDVLRREGSRC
jgi:hypothetical protein